MAGDVSTRLTRTYLGCRGVLSAIPPRCLSETLKDGEFPFGPGQRSVGMLALIRNIVTDEPQAVHRTALTPAGAKATINGMSRKSMGPLDGGAIKLSPDGDVETCLGIAEGIETRVVAAPPAGVRDPAGMELDQRRTACTVACSSGHRRPVDRRRQRSCRPGRRGGGDAAVAGHRHRSGHVHAAHGTHRPQ